MRSRRKERKQKEKEAGERFFQTCRGGMCEMYDIALMGLTKEEAEEWLKEVGYKEYREQAEEEKR